MAPPRKHSTGRILDAARTVALRDGPRATSVAAIAQESGAPAGTLYHRFGRRDRVLQETWLRALGRFHDGVLAAAGDPDPVEAGVAMAVAAVGFARQWPDDARLLVDVRRRDLLDGDADPAFQERLAAANAPVEAAIARLVDALGLSGAEGREAVLAAVVDLPGAAVRRHARPTDRRAGTGPGVDVGAPADDDPSAGAGDQSVTNAGPPAGAGRRAGTADGGSPDRDGDGRGGGRGGPPVWLEASVARTARTLLTAVAGRAAASPVGGGGGAD